MRSIERAFVDAVNLVGVNVNLALTNANAASMLQYVCGFGPRKAQGILKAVQRKGGFLESRQDLVLKGLVGACVYMNCASFVRIRAEDLPTSRGGRHSTGQLDVLDNTRIHPENYELARKMASDALDLEDAVLDDDENPSLHVEELMQCPEKLNDLLLEDYASELERRSNIKKRITLEDIKRELQEPYRELRRPYMDLDITRVFTLLTGETDRTLFPGLILPATVLRITDKQQVVCRLDSGLTAMIATRNLSDQFTRSPEEIVQPGKTVMCRVLSVVKDRFMVDVSVKPSDLDLSNRKFADDLARDQFYDFELERRDLKADEEARVATKQRETRYLSRRILHPLFKNVAFSVAEKMLDDKTTGDVVIRPSSKGADHLTVTWKLTDGVYHHIDIREEDKENDWSLGRALYIAGDRFDDLDEVVARYIEPMAELVREVLSNPKYRRGSKEELSKCFGSIPAVCGSNTMSLANLVKDEKRQNPSRIPYLFGLSTELPGRISLHYQPGSKTRVEYIKLGPDGFLFRERRFSSLRELMIWFKQHFHEAPSARVRRSPNHGSTTPASYNGRAPGGYQTSRTYEERHSGAEGRDYRDRSQGYEEHRGSERRSDYPNARYREDRDFAERSQPRRNYSDDRRREYRQ